MTILKNIYLQKITIYYNKNIIKQLNNYIIRIFIIL